MAVLLNFIEICFWKEIKSGFFHLSIGKSFYTGKNGSRTIATLDDWMIAPGHLHPPPRIIAPWVTAPRLLLPENFPKDNCPLTISPWKLTLKKIAFRMICCLHNCPSGKWSQENCPQENSPRINYTWDIFSPRIRNLSTLIHSCFLLFSFFVV